MRVSIDHKETNTGLIFKKVLNAVVLEIAFSEEEKAVIGGKKYRDYIVMERGWDAMIRPKAEQHPDHYNSLRPPHLYVGDLLKGPDTYYLDNSAEAKAYEDRLTDSLKTFKSFIEANSTKAESKSFDL